MTFVADRFRDPEATITSLLENRWSEEEAAVWCRLVDAAGAAHSVTVGELMTRAMGYAAAFGSAQNGSQEIGICLRSGVDLHAAFVGAVWAGHVPTMLPPPSPRMEPGKYARNLRHTLECVRPSVLVLDTEVHRALQDAVLPRACEVRFVDPRSVPDGGRVEPWGARPDDVALVQHSSGTTGLQKGIALSHRAIVNHHRSYAGRLEMTTGDLIVSWLPLYHDMGFVACFLLPLLGGMRVVELSPFDWVSHPSRLLSLIHQEGGTLCWLPNFAYAFMAQSIEPRDLPDGLDVRSIRAWINCSEPVSHASEQAFLTAFAEIGVRETQFTASYAMAENVFAVTQSLPGRRKVFRADRDALLSGSLLEAARAEGRIVVSNGTPVEGTEVRILDAADQPMAAGQIGQIAIKGHTLFSGYYRRDDLTAAAMTAEGWYRTGDLGFVHDDELFVTGRQKDLIVVQGRKYYPADIEEIVSRVDGVAPGRVAAFGVSDESAGTEKLAVLAEPEPGWNGDVRRLALAIRSAVAQHIDCTPGVVKVVPPRSLVKSSSGKVARADNRDKLNAGGF